MIQELPPNRPRRKLGRCAGRQGQVHGDDRQLIVKELGEPGIRAALIHLGLNPHLIGSAGAVRLPGEGLAAPPGGQAPHVEARPGDGAVILLDHDPDVPVPVPFARAVHRGGIVVTPRLLDTSEALRRRRGNHPGPPGGGVRVAHHRLGVRRLPYKDVILVTERRAALQERPLVEPVQKALEEPIPPKALPRSTAAAASTLVVAWRSPSKVQPRLSKHHQQAPNRLREPS
mmetsp:Transcript_30092/g.89458  ORF Transcript_30092/g.89458 Transcript_30092/m.89458 type:complete len:230 (-) Transcript_30092:1511-2200(-)